MLPTLITFSIFFMIMFYMLLSHNHSSKQDMMSIERCDRISCNYCSDLEQCKQKDIYRD